jgi:hypothetical protein
MTKEWTEMVELAPQVKAVLRELDTELVYTVLSRWPRREDKGNLITVTEITNRQTALSVVDDLAVQVDIWSTERDVVRALAPLVNAAVCGMGLRRDYAGAIEQQNGGLWAFRKTFRFGRRVDKRFMRLID